MVNSLKKRSYYTHTKTNLIMFKLCEDVSCIKRIWLNRTEKEPIQSPCSKHSAHTYKTHTRILMYTVAVKSDRVERTLKREKYILTFVEYARKSAFQCSCYFKKCVEPNQLYNIVSLSSALSYNTTNNFIQFSFSWFCESHHHHHPPSRSSTSTTISQLVVWSQKKENNSPRRNNQKWKSSK